MGKVTLTASRIAWKHWVLTVQNEWNYKVSHGEMFGMSWPHYLKNHIMGELLRHKGDAKGLSDLKYIIIHQLPSLTACEIIEEYDL